MIGPFSYTLSLAGDEPVGPLVFHFRNHPSCVIQISQCNTNDIPSNISTCIVISIHHFFPNMILMSAFKPSCLRPSTLFHHPFHSRSHLLSRESWQSQNPHKFL